MLVKILNIFRPSPNSLPRLRFTPGKFSSQNRFLPDLPSAIGLRLSIPDKIQSIGPVHPSRYLRPGNILRENHELPAPDRKKGKSWADFIAAHKDVLVGCDFFTKEVWTLGGLVTYYVLFFMHVATRKVYIAGFTKNPNEQWMKQIARNVTMNAVGFLDGMKYLICDRDGKFAPSFRNLIESAGIEILRLPPRSPNLNAFAERFVRSIKEECLDPLILFGEASLQRALDQYIQHYHHERPHQGKENVILFPNSEADNNSNPSRAGPVLCNRRLGGLLKFYYRKAA